jgi:peroxiredoxin
MSFANLSPGDPAPWFQLPGSAGLIGFDAFAGRYIVLCFLESANNMGRRQALRPLRTRQHLFDGDRAVFFAISNDPKDKADGWLHDRVPGVRILWDFEHKASRLFGAAPQANEPAAEGAAFRPRWIVIDPTLHVHAIFPLKESESESEAVFQFVEGLPHPKDFAGFEIPAPILILPNVLEPPLRQRLIELYDSDGGSESGIVRNSKLIIEASFKRRKDYTIEDSGLKKLLRQRIWSRVTPEIKKLFFMDITRMERYIVGCYAAEDGGHFKPHRDNNPGLTAHRRFAVSINLNDDFEGGGVVFPEYNRRPHKVPAGWAVIFPCAILHQVTRVTAGRREAFLPFVYDESGAKLREESEKTPEGQAFLQEWAAESAEVAPPAPGTPTPAK